MSLQDVLWTSRAKEKIVILCSCLMIFLFIYAGVTKFIDHQKFVADLGKSPILTKISKQISIVIPLIEIIIALLLTIKRFRLLAMYMFYSLMISFVFYILAIVNFSSYIPCSCGGLISNMSWSQHLIFNLAWILLSVFAIFTETIKEHSV